MPNSAISNSGPGISQATADARYVQQSGGGTITGGLTVTGEIDATALQVSYANVSGTLDVSGDVVVEGALRPTGGVVDQARTITGTDTIGVADRVILLDASSGNVVATLPAAGATEGQVLSCKRIDSSGNTCTVNRAGSDTIDGGTSVSFSALQAREFRATSASTWHLF